MKLEQVKKDIDKYFDNITNLEFYDLILKYGLNKDQTYIKFDEVMKVQKEVCKVLHVERVKKSNKLLKMIIQTSDDIRIVLTNLGEIFDIDYFTDNNFVFTLNIEPNKIMGIPSNGMICAFEKSDGSIIPLKVDLPVGTKLF